MADLTLERDADEPPAAPDTAPTEAADGHGVPAFGGRYRVLADQPLPHLSTPSGHAFAAFDNEDTSRRLYGLILERMTPFRAETIAAARGLGELPVVKPVRWGRIEWPLSRRQQTLLLLTQPPGQPLMASADATVRPLPVHDLRLSVAKSLAATLAGLNGQRLVHRNIRPTNLFRSGEGSVFAGEFFSGPAGFNQPAVFEPIERAMCIPTGRGHGEIGDDLFAVGVTLAFLALGKNPVAHLDDQTLVEKRIQLGSYAAILGEHRVPPEVVPVIRALLRDSVHERWTIDDLALWATDGIVNPAQPVSSAKSDRAFEFADGYYSTPRELAAGFSRNWAAARGVVMTDEVERWAVHSVKDRELGERIAACRLSEGRSPRMVSDDLLLARTIIALDPEGPLRYRGFHAMPDGLGNAVVSVIADETLAAVFKEMVTSQLVSFWFDRQQRQRPWAAPAFAESEKMLTFLGHSGPGFGIERCLYQTNRGLACQSPRFLEANALQAGDMMEALEAAAPVAAQLIDRHVAGFLAAHFSGSVDAELNKLEKAKDGAEVARAQLMLLAAVQYKHGPAAAPQLCAYMLRHVEPLLRQYRNTELRRRLTAMAERVAQRGDLAELANVVASPRHQRWDQKGFDQARRQYRAYGKQIVSLEASFDAIAARSQVLGRRLAARFAACIGAVALGVVIMSRLG